MQGGDHFRRQRVAASSVRLSQACELSCVHHRQLALCIMARDGEHLSHHHCLLFSGVHIRVRVDGMSVDDQACANCLSNGDVVLFSLWRRWWVECCVGALPALWRLCCLLQALRMCTELFSHLLLGPFCALAEHCLLLLLLVLPAHMHNLQHVLVVPALFLTLMRLMCALAARVCVCLLLAVCWWWCGHLVVLEASPVVHALADRAVHCICRVCLLAEFTRAAEVVSRLQAVRRGLRLNRLHLVNLVPKQYCHIGNPARLHARRPLHDELQVSLLLAPFRASRAPAFACGQLVGAHTRHAFNHICTV